MWRIAWALAIVATWMAPARGEPAPGDLNLDGIVDRGDIDVMVEHFGQRGLPLLLPGDLNLDGRVDYDDFFTLADHAGERGETRDQLPYHIAKSLCARSPTFFQDFDDLQVWTG